MTLERFEGEWNFVIGAFFCGEPIFFPDAVGEINGGHAYRGLDGFLDRAGGGGFGGSARKDFAHGFEHREAEHDAGAFQKSATREHPVFHHTSPVLDKSGGGTGSWWRS